MTSSIKKTPGTTSTTQAVVAQVWSDVLQAGNIDVTKNFFDLGGDSLKAIEVISRLQAMLEVELPLIAFFEDPTVVHVAAVADELRLAKIGSGNGNPAAVSVTQAAIAKVWSEVLRVEGIEAGQNFFDLGGDSLKAIEVISRLRAQLNVELPLIAFFEDPTIAHLAAVADELRSQAGTQPGVIPATAATPPLSFSQLMFWLLQETDPTGHLHNQPRMLRIRGNLRADLLQSALDEVCRRHEVLRARYEPGPGEPVQVIDPQGRVELQLEDVSSFAIGAREEAALAIARKEWERPFNLATELSLRARLLRLGSDDHLLIVITHHLVTDGHTPAVLFQELGAIYDGLLAKTPPALPDLQYQYPEFAAWQRENMRGSRLEAEMEYWRSRLADAPAMLDLPTDKPRPERSNHAGEWCRFMVPRATLENLKDLASAKGSTLFTVILSALRIVLYRWTSQQDMVIGTVASNRTRAGADRLIGCFLNFLPLRNSVSPDETAAGLLSREKQIVMDAFAHQDCPFPKMVAAAGTSRITDANPIYNVALLLQSFAEPKFGSSSLSAEVVELTTDTAQLDLRFVATERNGGLQLDCEFRTELFDGELVAPLLEGFAGVLEALADNPERRVADFAVPRQLLEQAKTARRRKQRQRVAIASTFTAGPVEAPLAFWMNHLAIPAGFEFAPYDQVFQQLLDPASLLSENSSGVNVVLLRLTDWVRFEESANEGEKKNRIERSALELVSAMKAASGRAPFLVCLCPAADKFASDPRWAEFLAHIENEIVSELSPLAKVQVITAAQVLDLYPVEKYEDKYADKVGHIPYVPEFFVALATMLARRILALRSAPKRVMVLDCDATIWKGRPEAGVSGARVDTPQRVLQEFAVKQLEAGMLVCLCSKNTEPEVNAAFAGQPDMLLQPELIISQRFEVDSAAKGVLEIAEDLQIGLDSFVFISADAERCHEVRARCPKVMSLLLPGEAALIPVFLDHAWVFDSVTGLDALLASQNRTLERTASELSDVGSISRAMDAERSAYRPEAGGFVEPRTMVEEMVASAWAEVLKLDRVGIHDNFFSLGGHSLLATQVVARVRRTLEVELPLRAMFEAPTVAEFAKRIEAIRQGGRALQAPPIARFEDREHLPLSFAQQRLWFLDQLDPGNPLYNMPQMFRMGGKLNVDALKWALNRIVERHESLRTTFAVLDNEPVQAIAPRLHLALPVIDLSAVPVERREEEALKLAKEEAQRPFDLAAGPVVRAQLLRLDAEDHALLLTQHHVVTDRWSMGLVSEELAAHYSAFVEGKASSLPDLQIQYADFAVWQRNWLQGEVLDAQLQYWKQQLAAAPQVLGLPTDHPRPAQTSMRGAVQSLVLPRGLNEKLVALSRNEGVTLFMTLLAAFQTLLARYSGQEDIVIGSPIANRNFAELEPLIGFFVNTLALRGDLSGDPSFRELVARVKEVCLQAYAHQDIPFEKLVEELQPERSLSYSPIFQVLFALQNAPMRALQLPGIKLERMPIHPGTSIFDMSWFLIEVPEGLMIRAEYSTDLFEDATIARALQHFQRLLESVVAHPEQRVSELAILGEEERQKVLVEFNATEAEFPSGHRLHDFFEASAGRVPEATALVCGMDRISYGELNARANQIAHYLMELGAAPDVLVGVFLERTPELLTAILGVLKSGAAYVPLDPSYPRDRISAILEDTKAPIVLTQKSLTGELSGSAAKIIRVDDDWPRIARESRKNPASPVKPENLAYVLFTSGSTGRPKGVALEHRSVTTFVQWAQTVFTPGELAGGLLSTSVCFDLSIFEIFVPLSVGGKVIVVQNALFLATAEAKNEVTLINTVPSAMAELVRMKAVPDSVKTINLAGEALTESLVNEVYSATSVERLYNLYGPTEDTTYSTYTLTCRNEPVTVGRPLANTQAYVLDPRGNPLPIGVPGELHLGGAGLARGYYGRPDLTAERFVPNPFAVSKNARMYKTGDLCRWLADGNLEYVGRLDNQVKLRGYRIELGEIEAVLAKHAGVRQCLVMAREDEPGMKRLVAYVVPAGGERPSEDGLREHLKQSLPDFMIPSAFVMLEAFPLTPNGKVNRKALAPPEQKKTRDEEYVAPRTPFEEAVAAIWAKVLRLERVSVHDDFFAIGGHSLLATQVISRIRQSLGYDLPLRTIFEASTVAELAKRVEALEAPAGRYGLAIQRAPRTGAMPLSFAQQRLWFLNELERDNPLYNVPIAIGMTGRLDFEALQGALNEIVGRHEVLRTTFSADDNRPVQVIAPELTLDIGVLDLTRMAEEEQRAAVSRLAIEGAKAIFDLKTGPLFRANLLRLSERDHVLLMNMHHIVSDGWSMWQFIRELAAIYGAYEKGKPSPLPALTIQYADYAVWQRNWMHGEVLEQHLNYWKEQLAGAATTFELPADRVRPPIQTYRGTTKRVKFSPELLKKLKNLSGNEGATLFMTLLAAYQTLLYRYTGQEDMVVGTPIANRNRAEIEELIGFFVNALVMRTDLSGAPTFRTLLQRVRSVSLEAYAHQDLPFERLVEALAPERDLTRTPLFQVWFALQNAPRAEFKLPGLELRSIDVHNGTSKFDLGLFVVEKPDGLHCMVEYSTDLFDSQTIDRFIGHFEVLLESISANPDQAIGDLPILTPAERQQVVVDWNRTEVEYPRTRSLHQFIEEQAEKTPDAPALVFESKQLTYRELNARANQLAHYLRKQGVGPEVLVGICAERSLEMVIGLLGIVKAGGAYVPLDPDHPRDRLAAVIEDAAPPVLLTQEHLADVLPEHNAPLICLDRDWSLMSGEPTENLECITTGKDQAYAIFTSGSTGKPKGVPNVHEGIVNRLLWMQHAYGLNGSDRVLQKTPYSFDVSVWEFFWPLMTGACLVVAKPEGHKDPNYIRDLIQQQKITTLHFVPSMLRIFLEAEGVEKCSSLRRVICSGEALPLEVQDRFFQRLKAELHNLYGPTEAAVDVTYWQCIPDYERSIVPIGRPIWNSQIYILDPKLQPVPIGIPGELHIGGVGLARGYLNRPQLTAEKFINDPYSAQPGARLYKTGDLCRFLADGNIEYLGRIDHQVKIRGFRIELGEIESTLDRHPSVRQSVVVAREDAPGDKSLVAYVVPDTHYRGPGGEGSEDMLTSEQVSQWAMTFDEAYQRGGSAEDATFNIVGWNSSYTNQPIPAEEMRVWVESTVERILALKPKKVWEIGCGTGLLLFRVAPRCVAFHGTDVSQRALDFLTTQMQRPGLQLPQVTLDRKPAHDFSGRNGEKVDAIVINSVIQYFPDLEYLVSVLKGAIDSVRDGGSVFIGDVRHLALLEAFHTSVQLHQAPRSLPCSELVAKARKNMRQEGELLVDPEFFSALQQRLPRISRIETNLKRGRAHNELMRFRYDVVLHVGERPTEKLDCPWLDWNQQGLAVQSLREILRETRPDVMGVTGVPNARLQGDAAAMRLLASGAAPASAGELRVAVEREQRNAVEPEDLWALGNDVPYDIEIRSSRTPGNGLCDVVFWRKTGQTRNAIGVPRYPGESSVLQPLEAYANNPLQQRIAARLAPELRRWLAGTLPEYMVPQHFVLLDTMPLSANGKADRKALPAPDQSRVDDESAYAAPSTPTEELLASIWAEVLRIERAGVTHDFFALGGHSLSATQVVARIRQAFQVELPLRTLFESPTIRGLAAIVDRAQRGGLGAEAPPIVSVSREQEIPLSFAQQRLWFLDQMDPGNPLYNVPRTIRMKGTMDVAALRKALNDLVARHEVLRTRYVAQDSHPVQKIETQVTLEMPAVEVSGRSAAEKEEGARRVLQAESGKPFDLASGPVLDAKLYVLSDDEHILFLNMHHIATDGWSTGVLLNDLAALYQAAKEKTVAQLPELDIQYADYAAWQRNWLRGEVLEKQLAYWRQQLEGAPPVLTLPTDRPRPVTQTFRGATYEHVLPRSVADAVRVLSRQHGATPFMTLLASFDALLYYLSGQEEIVVGTDMANRTSVKTEPLIGFFVNLLVLRLNLGGNPSFEQLMARARELALGAYAHQDVPFDKLVEELRPERNLSHSPLVQVLFVQQNTPRSTASFPGLEISRFKIEVQSKFDIAVFVSESSQEIASSWVYNPDLFDHATIARMAANFELALRTAAAQPEIKLDALCATLAGADKQQRESDQKKFEETGLAKLKKIRRRAIEV